MKRTADFLLVPLTLLEWGAILIYFYWSERLAEFVIPAIRLPVLATGILLLLTGFWLLAAGAIRSESTRRRGTAAGRVLAFLLLLLPIAAAAKIARGAFERVPIENGGAPEGGWSGKGRGLPVTIAPKASGEPAEQADGSVLIPKGWTPPRHDTGGYTTSISLPEAQDNPSKEEMARALKAGGGGDGTGDDLIFTTPPPGMAPVDNGAVQKSKESPP